MPDTYLRPRQAAAYMGVAGSTFYRVKKAATDFPAPIRVGKRAVYAVSDLDKYMRSKQEHRAGQTDPDIEREAAENIRKHRRDA